MRLQERPCPHCGESFRPEKSTQKFCGLVCFNAQAGGARDQPEPPPVPGARWIPLTQGKFALVDEALHGDLSLHKWLAVKTPAGHWYAKRVEYRDGRRVGIYMHNAILNTPIGFLGDHRNGDGLDNRAHNLRVATNAQNQMNKAMRGKSGFKGVWSVPGGKFAAKVFANERYRYLGRFKTAEDAARAYDAEARKMHGTMGRYNFPLPGERSALENLMNTHSEFEKAAGLDAASQEMTATKELMEQEVKMKEMTRIPDELTAPFRMYESITKL